jgi:hypothetical protein
MKKTKRFLRLSLLTVISCAIFIGGGIKVSAADELFNVSISSSQIVFYPKASYGSVTLNVALPDGTVQSENFSAGVAPSLIVSGYSGRLPDGKYT